jgi:hypothetical protein
MEAFIKLTKDNMKGLVLAYNWLVATIMIGFLAIFLIHHSKLSTWTNIKNTASKLFGHNDIWVSILILLIVVSPWIVFGFSKLSSIFFPLDGGVANPYKAKGTFVRLVGILLGTLILIVFLLFNGATRLELNVLFFALWIETLASLKTIFYIIRVSK